MINLEITDDSILLFEYFTASGVDDPAIISEACEIIRSLVLDLKDEDIIVLLSKDFKNLFDDFNFEVKTIVIEVALEEWLEENAIGFSRSIFVSAENDMNLYNLTKILESKDIKLYCSDSYAVKLCSDKYETFDYLKNKVKQPLTFNILINPKTYWKRAIQIFFDELNGDYGDTSNKNDIPILQKPKDIPILDNSDRDLEKAKKLIAKPRFGVDCENLKIISSKRNIDELEDIFETGSRFVIQEYIQGDVCSVSLISDGKTSIPLSLNKQIVEIDENGGRYIGGYLPYEHPLKDKAFEISKRACEFIPGLKGVIGVDLIIQEDTDEIFIIEINSRFTTSYVGLQKVANFNIAKSTIDLLDKKITINQIQDQISYKSQVSFLKNDKGILNIKVDE